MPRTRTPASFVSLDLELRDSSAKLVWLIVFIAANRSVSMYA